MKGRVDSLVLYRVWPEHWLTDRGLGELIGFFRSEGRSVDEVLFFSDCIHAPLPLEEHLGRMERLRGAMAAVRAELGVRAGVNVLSTMGHRDEDPPSRLTEPWAKLTDRNGVECRSCYCPSDPRFLDYAAAVYAAAARSGPDVVWVDDDLRMANHQPTRWPCFCARCLKSFGTRIGRAVTREDLVALFNAPSPAWRETRGRWIEFNRERLDLLLRVIEGAVHGVAPALPMGLMTGEFFWDGGGYAERVRLLAGASKAEVLWRPGGGFWNDVAPMAMVAKGHAIGRQIAALPPEVRGVQAEIENIPYQRLSKSVHMTLVECAVDMAVGCVGIQHNVLPYRRQPLDEHRPFLSGTREARPFLEALRRVFGRSPAAGVWPAWKEDLYVASGGTLDWFGAPDAASALRKQYVLSEIGLPLCYDRGGARAVTMGGPLASLFTDEELTALLRGGLYLDAEAWQEVAGRGLGHLTGVDSVAEVQRDVLERMTAHPLNGVGAGITRDCRPGFFAEPGEVSRCLTPSDGAQVLARIENYHGEDYGAAMTVFENRLGGRVAVSGYFPWTGVHSLAKSVQLKALFLWLSRDTLPCVVESYARVVIWARALPDGRRAFFLLNASHDAARDVTVRLAGSPARFVLMSMDGRSCALDAGGILPAGDMPPWTALLAAEESAWADG